MRVWLIKEGENLPLQGGARKMRMWILAETLAAAGHEVVWWHSTFSHQLKKKLSCEDGDHVVGKDFCLRLSEAGGYEKNISFARYRHHRRLANRCRERAPSFPEPDAVVCAYPPIDLAASAVEYCRSRRIPIILDVRDVWPDTMIRKLPAPMRRFGPVLFHSMIRSARRTLRAADALVAVSDGFLVRALEYGSRARGPRDRVIRLGYQKVDGALQPSPRLSALRARVQGGTLLTFVGSFGHSYELTLLASTARTLWEEGRTSVHFAFAGDGRQRARLERLTRGLPNVHHLGWLDAAEIRFLLEISSIGLVPCISDRDTVPNKPFEYLSAGLPILSSLEGEMETLVDRLQVGRSYPVGDHDALRNHIVELLDSPEVLEMLSKNATLAFERHFSAEVVYKEFVDLICEVGGSRPS